MPLFEYDCSECGRPFEELVLSTANSQAITCPRCGSPQVKKKISRFASKVSGGSSVFSTSSAACSTGGT